MNQFTDNNSIEKMLEETANQIEPNSMFAAELEEKLKKAHKPRRGFSLPTFGGMMPLLARVGAMGALAVFVVWLLTSLQPAIGSNNEYVCRVTEPNGSTPPGETTESIYYLGNGELWTSLWPDGIVQMQDGDRLADGTFSMKWGFWRSVTGPLTIEGRRLDADAPPLRADIPEGYGDTGFQVTALIFPTTGCWEVTARVGDSSLTFVTNVVHGEAAPVTEPVIEESSTPISSLDPEGGYDFRGTKLYLEQPLPATPVEANVYLMKEEQPATLEEAVALAGQFGVQGEVYTRPGIFPGTTEFVITDGMKMISVYSKNYFGYTADIAQNYRPTTVDPSLDAEPVIREFFASHGFDFQFQVTPSKVYGGYLVNPLAPDGLPIRYDLFTIPIMRVVLDQNGQVLIIESRLAEYEPAASRTFGILTAEEAFAALLDDTSVVGKFESMSSVSYEPPQTWYRDHPNDQTVTIYGALTMYPGTRPDQNALIMLDGIPVFGNTKAMEALDEYTFVGVTGKYVLSNTGARIFMVDSFQTGIQQMYLSGSLIRRGDQIVLTTDDGSGTEYILLEPPADVPLNTEFPESQLAVGGALVNGQMDWTIIQYYADSSQMGGGGGGGGMGFYQLNLSGTPIPFPTGPSAPVIDSSSEGFPYTVVAGDTCESIAAVFNVTVAQLVEVNNFPADCSTLTIDQTITIPYLDALPPPRFDGQRGMLAITIYEQADGGQRVQYSFITDNPDYPYLTLEGENLDALLSNNGRPVDVWGTIGYDSEIGIASLNMERFEIPFPDLQFQVLKGEAQTAELEGQAVLLFTDESGQTYVELGPDCYNIIGEGSVTGTGGIGEPILLEALAIPGKTFGGYPALCVFSTAMAINPQTNEPYELSITADQPNILPAPPSAAAGNLPAIIIEKVELVNYAGNPMYQSNDPAASGGSPYIQPAWVFSGHYENGDVFLIAVQALKQEFLSPELQSYIPPG